MIGPDEQDTQIEKNMPSNVHVMLEGVVVSGMMKAIEIYKNSVNTYIKSTNSL
ncbi:MAG: hypothetical protein IJ418_05270 [Clostridia bacterium]|nr:hypothetical protein [Clostridia bacterium]